MQIVAGRPDHFDAVLTAAFRILIKIKDSSMIIPVYAGNIRTVGAAIGFAYFVELLNHLVADFPHQLMVFAFWLGFSQGITDNRQRSG